MYGPLGQLRSRSCLSFSYNFPHFAGSPTLAGMLHGALEKMAASHGRTHLPKERRGRRPISVEKYLARDKAGTLFKEGYVHGGMRVNGGRGPELLADLLFGENTPVKKDEKKSEKTATLLAFLDELQKIAAFTGSSPPPQAWAGAAEAPMFPKPQRLPGATPPGAQSFTVPSAPAETFIARGTPQRVPVVVDTPSMRAAAPTLAPSPLHTARTTPAPAMSAGGTLHAPAAAAAGAERASLRAAGGSALHAAEAGAARAGSRTLGGTLRAAAHAL